MTEDVITDWQCKACELNIGELDQPYHCCKGGCGSIVCERDEDSDIDDKGSCISQQFSFWHNCQMIDKDGNPVLSFKEATTDFVPALGILCNDCRASCDKCCESVCRLCVKMCIECAKERDAKIVNSNNIKHDDDNNDGENNKKELEIAILCNKNALENPQKNIYKNYSVDAMDGEIKSRSSHFLCADCSNHCTKCENFYCDNHYNPEKLAVCNDKCLQCKKDNVLYQESIQKKRDGELKKLQRKQKRAENLAKKKKLQ